MYDLLVVGAGHLGTRVAVLWRNRFPECQIYLKTKTENAERSKKWRRLGYQPVASTDNPRSIPKFPFVVYSVPPISGRHLSYPKLTLPNPSLYLRIEGFGVHKILVITFHLSNVPMYHLKVKITTTVSLY